MRGGRARRYSDGHVRFRPYCTATERGRLQQRKQTRSYSKLGPNADSLDQTGDGEDRIQAACRQSGIDGGWLGRRSDGEWRAVKHQGNWSGFQMAEPEGRDQTLS